MPHAKNNGRDINWQIVAVEPNELTTTTALALERLFLPHRSKNYAGTHIPGESACLSAR
jgi:hypothetical protein